MFLNLSDREAEPPSLVAVFIRFLKFGLLAWGGPVAQIALVKRELVDEEKWLSPERFNRLLAVYQVLPGPEAHELCVHLGMTKRGRMGGLMAGLGFMLPGFLLILGLAWVYERLNLRQPLLEAAFLGIQIGVIALIARAVHRIGEHVLINRWLWVVGTACAVGSFIGVSFWILLPTAGLTYAALSARRFALAAVAVMVGAAIAVWATEPVMMAVDGPTHSLVAPGPIGALPLFVSGLKAGLLTFGGAYTAIPFVRHDAVGRGWISETQFLDSLALGGIIPAPLIMFATFVGYLAGGLTGSLAITAGIFLPAFSFALLFYDRLERVVEDERLHHLLEGVAAGVVGMIAVTALQLGWSVAQGVPSIPIGAAIFAASLALLYLWKSKLNVLAAVAGTALAGLLIF